MGKETILWYDYETTGTDPKRDRVVQFAGIRTDHDLNIIDEPLNWFAKLADDIIPNPYATLVTGITPQQCQQNGIVEAEFFAKIHQQMSQANTCTVGYNTIRFDDEFTRYGLYRNFFDPYTREWQRGNSRWDILDLVRATHDLRPGGINWPSYETGRPCFKLEELAKANNLGHEQAHDALSDVYATIAMAQLIRQKQPKLFDFFFNLRRKQAVLQQIDLKNKTPFVHTSRMFCRDEGCTSIMMPLAMHPKNRNSVIAYDLRIDPTQLLTMNAEQIKERLYTKWEELGEDETPMAIKQVHVNKSPMIAPLSVLDDAAAKRLNIDIPQCMQHIDRLKQAMNLEKTLNKVFESSGYTSEDQDPDHALYGGFFNESDKHRIAEVQQSKPQELQHLQWNFSDERLDTLLFRYKARNYPETLNDLEKLRWQLFKKERLVEGRDEVLTFEQFFTMVEELRVEHQEDQDKLTILDHLENYVTALQDSL